VIAQRFRPVAWVAGVAVAATALYMVSLGVANERARLETIDRKIAMTKREIRQLQTEIGTRASLRQLERWNGDVLALGTPTATQFLSSEAALASLDGTKLPNGSVPPPVMMASVAAQLSVQMASSEASTLSKNAAVAGKARVASLQMPVVVRVKDIALRPTVNSSTTKAQRVAMLDMTLVNNRTLSDIVRQAAAEAAPRGSAQQ
jgi:hypothetical protein